MKPSLTYLLLVPVSLQLVAEAHAQSEFTGSRVLDALVETLVNPDPSTPLGAQVVAQGGCGSFNYLPTSSSEAEQRMCDGEQSIAPMFRMLDAQKVCDASTCPGALQPQGVAIASQPMLLERSVRGVLQTRCTSLTGDAMTTLRIVYAGEDGSGSPEACAAPKRRELVSNLTALFGNCDDAQTCQQGLTQAFRLGDSVRATQTLQELAGIQAFCNGDEREDKDPIRRPCTDKDRYCRTSDQTIGLVLPIRIDTVSGEPIEEINNGTNCAPGRFRWALNFGFGNETCPYDADPIAGLCLYPIDKDQRFGCSARGGRLAFASTPSVASGTGFDPRAYNLAPRLFNGRRARVSNIGSTFYRLRAECAEKDNTSQMRCLTREVNCSLGWNLSNTEAGAMPKGPHVEELVLNNTTSRDISYPLKRDYYLNATSGFADSASFSIEESKLVECMFDQTEHATLGGRTLLQEAARLGGLLPVEKTRSTAQAATEIGCGI